MADPQDQPEHEPDAPSAPSDKPEPGHEAEQPAKKEPGKKQPPAKGAKKAPAKKAPAKKAPAKKAAKKAPAKKAPAKKAEPPKPPGDTDSTQLAAAAKETAAQAKSTVDTANDQVVRPLPVPTSANRRPAAALAAAVSLTVVVVLAIRRPWQRSRSRR